METLKSRKIQISMTQSGDPLETAAAERANGILKTEWLYRMDIPDGKKCKAELQRIIGFYNDERPHMSVGYQTPSEAYSQKDAGKIHGRVLRMEKKCVPLHRQKRITTVYATSDEKPVGHRAPHGFCQKRSHSGLSPSNDKQGVNQNRTAVNKIR